MGPTVVPWLTAVLSRYKATSLPMQLARKAIRQHLAIIAEKFSQGDFAIPMLIHARVPPGAETMKRLKSKITYEAEKHGARRATAHSHSRYPGAYCYPQLSPLPDPGSSNGRLPRSAKVAGAGFRAIRTIQALSEQFFTNGCDKPKSFDNLRLVFAKS